MAFCCCVETFGTFCVFVVLVQIICGVFRWLYANILGPQFGTPLNLKSFGSWALVTGATDGIGKEYAKQLAKKGLNIILVSRTLSKLETVAKEIRDSFGVQTAVIDVDFTSGPEIFDKVKEKVRGMEIGILVNNVGMSYDCPDFFLSIPNREKIIQDIVKCNITSMPMMCSIILPQMVQRKSGLIINISSLSASLLACNLSIYSGSKAFVNKFSEDLGAEYRSQGVIVQSILPGFVATNMTKLKKGSFNAPLPKQYVEAAMKTIGFAEHTAAYLPHALLLLASQLTKFLLPSLLRTLTLKTFEQARNSQIRKGQYTPLKTE